MLQRLKSIDVSAVKRLVKLRKEQECLQGYIDKAVDLKSSIEEEIFERVVDDYRERASTLAAEAQPLKAEAREQYAQLRDLLEEINSGLQEARAVKDEMEFRHRIGELNEKELNEAVGESEGLIASREKELAAAEKIRGQFLDAFGSEDELDAPADTPLEQGAPELESDAASDKEDVAASEDKTRIFNPDLTAAIETGDEPGAEATLMVPVGKLVQMGDGEPSGEHLLGALNHIGRSPHSDVCIDRPQVSRDHAVITANVGGFLIRDLGSPNGTFVNDEEISEHSLVHGDRITIGDIELVFHSE
jgi:hypothetical protein